MSAAVQPSPAAVRSGRRWALAPVALLAAAVAGQATIVVAAREARLGPEAEYDRRALRWDADRAAAATEGWRVDVAAPAAPGGAARRVVVTAADGAGRPLEGARVRAVARHDPARSSDVVGRDLAPAGPGRFEADLPVARPGRWELTVEVARGDARRVDVVTLEVAPDAP